MRRIGIELELTGITRDELVVALENLFSTKSTRVKSKSTDDGYYYYKVPDNLGNYWSVVRDRSIKPQVYVSKLLEDSSLENKDILDLDKLETNYMVELVSPILTSETLPTLFTIVSLIKSLGGLVNETCGIHVHIDSMGLEDCVDLFKRFVSSQEEIFKVFKVEENRRKRYCKLYSEVPLWEFTGIDDFLHFLWVHYRDKTIDSNSIVRNSKSLRYYGLNFYSLVTHGTIEYRLFNSTLEEDKIKSIIDWVINFSYQ